MNKNETFNERTRVTRAAEWQQVYTALTFRLLN
jgi:hypothetical protein